jgi:hypothetical protein
MRERIRDIITTLTVSVAAAAVIVMLLGASIAQRSATVSGSIVAHGLRNGLLVEAARAVDEENVTR